jgi:uncharacterized protein (DUF342 family)
MSEQSTAVKRTPITLTISKDSMTASVLIRVPKNEESSISVPDVLAEIDKAGVVFGVDHAAVERAISERQFNVPVKVAVGRQPERGINSSFVYHFDTSTTHKPKEDNDGHIDYRDISFIQNTESGTVLATRIPPTTGQPGCNVLGKEIVGPPGRDIPFSNGANTEISSDGLTLKATAGGVIQFTRGKISVSNVISIPTDVDHTTGNINCRGSVKVSGHIKAGYSVTIDGDLEVSGNVEDATIDVKGNIYVKGGFFGDGKGVMRAGGDIVMKFAEGQKLIAGNDIIIGGEMINCQVLARERVTLNGRRSKIVGGDTKAGKEIRSAFLGSSAGTLTNLTVAYDVELMTQYSEVSKEMQRQKDDAPRVKEALYSLYRLQMEGKLPPEKKAVLDKFESFLKELPGSLEELEKKRAALEQALSKFKDARIVADDTLHTGVRAHFGMVYRDMLQDQKRCKLTLEGNKVLTSDFRE